MNYAIHKGKALFSVCTEFLVPGIPHICSELHCLCFSLCYMLCARGHGQFWVFPVWGYGEGKICWLVCADVNGLSPSQLRYPSSLTNA